MVNVHDEKQGNIPNGASRFNRQETPDVEEADNTFQGIGTQVFDKAQEMGTHIRDTAQAVGTQIRDKAQEVGVQAQETFGEYYEQGRENLREVNKTVEAHAREKPLQALLVAGGIGLLLGLVWRRS